MFEQIEILMAGRNPDAHGPLTEAEVSDLRPAPKTEEVVDAFVRGRVPGGGADSECSLLNGKLLASA